MTTEQLKEIKELYATGEWLCVSAYLKNSIAIGWELNEDPSWWNIEDTVNGCAYKLIHKKHSEVLDHVLNGGRVKHYRWSDLVVPFDDNETLEEFIKCYDERSTYEIIKDKPKRILVEAPRIDMEGISRELRGEPDLNGHYCLANKEHYEKLIENGIPINCHPLSGGALDFKYILVRETITGFDEIPKAYQDKPMHLHNNEWVFGSLEYEVHGVPVSDIDKAVSEYRNPKPVEHTTKEELKQHIKNCRVTSLGKIQGQYLIFESVANKIIDDLCERIEYLEANQREK